MASTFKKAGYRVQVDDGGDRMSNKIRKAQKLKVPYMLVVGDDEIAAEGAAVRLRSGENLGLMKQAEILELLTKKSEEEKPEPPVLPKV